MSREHLGSIKSHVGAPNTLLDHYSDGKKLFVYDLEHKTRYRKHASEAGVIRGYYSPQIEALLCSEIEGPLGALLSKTKTLKLHEIDNLLTAEKDFLERFFLLQFARSKKVFNEYQDLMFEEPVNHSDFIKWFNENGRNPLSNINGKLAVRLIVAEPGFHFITNSLGFSFIKATKNAEPEMVVPFAEDKAFRVFSVKESEKEISHFICGEQETNLLNERCVRFEKKYGNGLIFALSEEMIDWIVGRL